MSVWGEFWDYLEQIVFEAETGRLTHTEVRERFVRDWGGVIVPKKIPREDPAARALRLSQMSQLRSAGFSERTVRAKLRGK
jgi:hypothetical protein